MKFKCIKCLHEFEVAANSREVYRNNITCPKCKGRGIKYSKIIPGKALADSHSLLKYRYRSR